MSDRGEYRGIRTVLVDGPDYQSLTPAARLVFLTLKLNLGSSGIDVLYAAQLVEQTGYPLKAVEAALAELERADWIRRERNVVWIVDGLKHEPSLTLANANHVAKLRRHLEGLPSLAIVEAFAERYGLYKAGALAVVPPSAAPAMPSAGAESGANGVETRADIPSPMPCGMPSEGDGVLLRTEELRTEDGELRTERAMRAGGRTANGPSPADEPPGFAEAFAAYPRRSGSNPRLAAAKAYHARLSEGEDPAEILAGVRRFAAWAAATGKVRTELVMQAKRFFGPERHYAESWESPPEPDGFDAEAFLREQREQEASNRAWLEQRLRERGEVERLAELGVAP